MFQEILTVVLILSANVRWVYYMMMIVSKLSWIWPLTGLQQRERC